MHGGIAGQDAVPWGVLRLALVGLLAVAPLLTACGDEEHELFVDLRTNLSPGTEFDNAVMELRDARGRLGEVVRTTDAAAIASHDYRTGRRVAEFVGLPAGDYTLLVELQLGGAAVVEVLVPITLSGDRAETVFVTRACAGTTCPMAGDDPTAVGCLYGACVDPACLLGDGSGCGSPTDAGPIDSGDVGPADSGPDADVGPVDSGADTGADTGRMCPSTSAWFTGTDNCTSSDDMAATSRADYGVAGDLSLGEVATSCGTGCLGDADLLGCTTLCVTTNVMMAGSVLSDVCGACYAGLFACGAELCLADCASDPSSSTCMACRDGGNDCGINCTRSFEACTGIVPPP